MTNKCILFSPPLSCEMPDIPAPDELVSHVRKIADAMVTNTGIMGMRLLIVHRVWLIQRELRCSYQEVTPVFLQAVLDFLLEL